MYCIMPMSSLECSPICKSWISMAIELWLLVGVSNKRTALLLYRIVCIYLQVNTNIKRARGNHQKIASNFKDKGFGLESAVRHE